MNSRPGHEAAAVAISLPPHECEEASGSCPRRLLASGGARMLRALRRSHHPGLGVPLTLMRGKRDSNGGFTLLETMIAMAIMMIAFASILMVQSSSLRSAMKAKQMNVVAMLARNKMVESELEWEGKPFSEIQKEKTGTFEEYPEYTWVRKIEEVKFPAFNIGAGSGEEGEVAAGGDMLTRVGRVVTAYFSKAVRQVKVTVSWKKGTGEQSFTVATYWIDLEAEFSINE